MNLRSLGKSIKTLLMLLWLNENKSLHPSQEGVKLLLQKINVHGYRMKRLTIICM